MASDEKKDTLYCICRRPYDETEFMIECEVCKDWFHGSCVGVQEYQAADIEIYHCPNCQVVYGPLTLKTRQNWHRHDYSDTGGASKAVQTGTVVFIKELKNRSFPLGDEIPVLRMPGGLLTKSVFEENGFNLPLLVDKKDGLGMTVPPPSFTIQDVEDLVGSMREIDVIDVSKQEDYKMLMREWTDYYNSPNREKIFNVISLEFSNTRLSDLVTVPLVVRDISWVTNGVWPDQLPEDTTYKRPEVTKYCLMGVRDSYTDFHIDFGGTSVWYHVLRGEKVFYMIRPTPANLNLYETWLNASNQSELFFGDQVDKCYKCVVKQGQTFFIPTGWIHAVFTPIDSLVFGGNFLHSYNVPMQLEAYAIEKRVKTPEKYLFPSFETINWYAAKHILDTMRDYIEDSKRPPTYIIDGAKALTFHLRTWTQRKDLNNLLFIKTAKHDVPETIQYGNVLKELGKIVKTYQDTMTTKPSTAKQKSEKKRKKKKSSGIKNMEEIDVLHMHTQNKLNEMEVENRKNVYNFEQEEEDTDSSATTAKTRRPKAGAFIDSSQESSEQESPEKNKRSLTLKVSNGKIVSERKRKASNRGEFQPLVSSDQEQSDDDGLVVDENPKSHRQKSGTQPALKLKLSILNKPSSKVSVKKDVSSDQSDSFSPPHQPVRSPPHQPIRSPPHQPIRSPPHQPIKSPLHHQPIRSPPHQPTSPHVSFPVPKSKSSLSPAAASLSSSSPQISTQLQSDLKSKQKLSIKPEQPAIKSELTLSDIISQSALSQGSSTLGTKLEPQNESGEPVTVEQALRMNIPTIRGGLNGSIADILEASGYGTETAFTVDDDINRAPSPSMREAIQGMLSMSRMGGLSGMQLFSRAESRRQAIKARSSLAMEDEEEQLSKCYQDDEYVYPTLELDEEETEQMLKGHSKPAKDETWNPKARVNISVPLGERQKREGAKRESVENSLAASSAKITSQPKTKRPYKKKLKLEMSPPYDAQPGTSSCLSPTHSGSAFRPGLKIPGSSVPTSPTKSRKPKKGQATAKQRLGKILKIHKMGMY